MALLAKAGTFNTPSSGSTNVTGLGFRPAALILWTENTKSDNAMSAGLDLSYGFWSRPRPALATRSQAAWVHSQNSNGTASATAGLDPSRPISNAGWNVASIVERTDNDGFTVTYGGGPPTGTRIHYLALSADALTQIMTVNVPANTVAGTRIPVRAVGFSPTGVLAISQALNTAAAKTLGFGAADAFGAQWAMSGASTHGVDPMDTGRRWNEANVVALADAAGVSLGAAAVAGYTDDGLDLLVTQTFTTATTLYVMCFGNALVDVGMGAKPTGTAPQVQAIATPFTPQGMVVATVAATSPTSTLGTHVGSLGAIAGGVQATGLWFDVDNLATSNSQGYDRIDAALLKTLDYATIAAIATGALTTTGANLTWNPNEATADRIGFFAIGNLQHLIGGNVDIETYGQTTTFWKSDLVGGVVQVATAAEGVIRPNNILGGDVVIDTAVTARIASAHRVGGNVDIATAPSASLALRHRIAGEVAIPTVAQTIFFWLSTPLGGNVDIATQATANLALKHRVGGNVDVPTVADAYFTYKLPVVRDQIPGRELSGTVNMHENPGAEDGLQGWYATGGATIAQEVTTVWEGARGVRVTLPGVAAGEGFYIRSVAGTDLTGQSRNIYGSVFAAANAVALKNYSVARYTDGSFTTGEEITTVVLTNAPDWQRMIAVPVSTDPAKKVAWIETYFVTIATQAGTIYADGAQMEEDRGDGPTQWASGSYTPETGIWAGIPNRSVVVRQPIAIQRSMVGFGGHYEIDVQLWRMTWDNQQVENISNYVTSGGVVADASRPSTWSIDCTMTRDGWEKMNPNFDWIAPFLTLREADGTTSVGQLGLYFVVPSEQQREEHRGTARVNAFDPLWLVARQGLTGNLVARGGVDKGRTLRLVLDGAVLTGGTEEEPGGRRRYFIPDTGKGWGKDKEWIKDDNRLVIANDIAKSAVFMPLYTSGTGFMSTRKRGDSRWKNREPVRVWSAHVPDDFVVPGYMRGNVFDMPHEIIGKIPTVPKAMDLFDEILLVNDDPDRNRVYVKGKIKGKNGKHPRVVGEGKGRHRTKKLKVPYLDDEATAVELAAALADDLSVLTEYTTITVVPDPRVDYINETVATAIYDMYGDEVAVGHWKVNRVQYTLWPASPRMTLELSRIAHGEDDVDIDVEIGAAVA